VLVDRRWWLVLGVFVTAVAALVADRLADREDGGPEPVSIAVGAEAILCAEVEAVPAEASSDGLQSGPSPEIEQDPRCQELAAPPRPGEVMIPRHSEADAVAGNVVVAGELQFDAQQHCFYVVAGDEEIGVLWPARFIGKLDPPRITDERNATVVGLGDPFEMRGRYVSEAGAECGPVDPESSGFIASSDVLLVTG
jgi:hypothetical protein